MLETWVWFVCLGEEGLSEGELGTLSYKPQLDLAESKKKERERERRRRGRGRGKKEGVRGGEREEEEERKEKKQDEDKERKKQHCWYSDMNNLWVQGQGLKEDQGALPIRAAHSPCGWGFPGRISPQSWN